jgi:hypothetical protein
MASPVGLYLTLARAFTGRIPATVRELPLTGPLGPTMVAAFGAAAEVEPAIVTITEPAIRAVHVTRVKPDGSGKNGDRAKFMMGRPKGSPIVLCPPNDLLGLVIVEGIETGLRIVEATGCGVWAAGSASLMPALADEVPLWIDCVRIVGDPDDAGRRGAAGLAEGVRRRGIHVEICVLDEDATT